MKVEVNFKCPRCEHAIRKSVDASLVSTDEDPDEPARSIKAFERLTPKERLVVARVVLCKSNREIADEMGNSEQAVKNRLRAIYDKVNRSNRQELIVFAYEHPTFKRMIEEG